MLPSIVHDLRFALRTLRKQPSFATIAVLTVGLGICANTAVFSVVSGALLEPLGYARPERLAAIWPARTSSNAELVYLQTHARAFTDVAAFSPGWGVVLTGTGEAAQLTGARTSTNFFATLDVRPLLGRAFADGESAPGIEPVVLLSHALWRARFGSDPAVIGRSVQLDGASHTIVGVMAGDFDFVQPNTDLWMPLEIDPAAPFYTGTHAIMIGRLQPGATHAAARRELQALAAPIREALQLPDGYGRDADAGFACAIPARPAARWIRWWPSARSDPLVSLPVRRK